MKSVNYIFRFVKWPTSDKKLFLEAVIFLFYTKAFIFFFPFKICVKKFKSIEKKDENIDQKVIKELQLAISRANKLAFWKNICLVRSLTARILLNRRGIASTIHLGVTFENQKKMNAHAWLMVDETMVTPKGRADFSNIFKI